MTKKYFVKNMGNGYAGKKGKGRVVNIGGHFLQNRFDFRMRKLYSIQRQNYLVALLDKNKTCIKY